jgi:uncharacterized protein YqiB (DUF1249 family)
MIRRMLIRDVPPYINPRPRSFAALMDLYEANYIRLRRLCPQLVALRGTSISRVAGAMDLHLTVLAHNRYTSDLSLTYLFRDEGGVRANPDLHLRIYFDARQVEVLSRIPHHRPATDAHHETAALLERWRENRFLYKWLGYCLHQGHGFRTAPADDVGPFFLTPLFIPAP